MRLPLAAAAILICEMALADVSNCACDPSNPESMRARQCSLCNEAEKAPETIFYLKDNNPRKPNRWLVLPKQHTNRSHDVDDLSTKERTALWAAAIAKAKELWGDEWGLAYNGAKVRTQCHAHIHIGKLLKYVERDNFIVVNGPAQIPKSKGLGLWVHPSGKKLHVHLNETTTETVLLR